MEHRVVSMVVWNDKPLAICACGFADLPDGVEEHIRLKSV